MDGRGGREQTSAALITCETDLFRIDGIRQTRLEITPSHFLEDKSGDSDIHISRKSCW